MKGVCFSCLTPAVVGRTAEMRSRARDVGQCGPALFLCQGTWVSVAPSCSFVRGHGSVWPRPVPLSGDIGQCGPVLFLCQGTWVSVAPPCSFVRGHGSVWPRPVPLSGDVGQCGPALFLCQGTWVSVAPPCSFVRGCGSVWPRPVPLSEGQLFACLLFNVLQQPSVSQGWICSDNCACCHTDIE